MTKLRKIEIVIDVLAVAMIVWFAYIGIKQGLTESPLGSLAAIMGLVYFWETLKLKKTCNRLSERLLDSELETAFREASTSGEIEANTKEINHKIDVGYYQGR